MSDLNALDVVIALALLASLVGGFRRGFWLGLALYAGAVGGLLLGARLAPDVVDRFDIMQPAVRQLVALLVILGAGGVGGSLAMALVGPLRRRLLDRHLLGTLDNLLGAALSTTVTLAVIWLVALTLARGPVPLLARTIQQSAVIRYLDQSAPVPPSFIARVQQILSGTLLPPVFAGLEPDLPSPSAPSPAAAATEGVQAAVNSTVRVEGTGCGGISTGSGFAVGDGLIVTNAHVVTGTGNTRVRTTNGRSAGATVVLFDPDRDLAILRVSGLDLPALAPGAARSGTQGAVIGYPGGGPLRISPAVIEGRLETRGRDIYSKRLVTRDIWTVTADVRPGNSGGPVVDEAGRFIGVVFAASVSNPGQAYALTVDEVAPSIQRAASERAGIDTRTFACVR